MKKFKIKTAKGNDILFNGDKGGVMAIIDGTEFPVYWSKKDNMVTSLTPVKINSKRFVCLIPIAKAEYDMLNSEYVSQNKKEAQWAKEQKQNPNDAIFGKGGW